MFLSIVIPTYNRWEKLARLLDSLMVQTSTDFEITVVDDGGDGDLWGFIRRKNYSRYVRYIFQPKYGYRLAAARNFGALVSNGLFVMFIDDDCVLQGKDDVDRVIRICREGLLKVKEYNLPGVFFVPKVVWWDFANNRALKERIPWKGNPKCIRKDLHSPDKCGCGWCCFTPLLPPKEHKYADFIWGTGIVFQRSSFSEVGGYDEAYKDQAGEDNDIALRLWKKGFKIIGIENIGLLHDGMPTGGGGKSGALYRKRKLEEGG